jgi:hypothetical protein
LKKQNRHFEAFPLDLLDQKELINSKHSKKIPLIQVLYKDHLLFKVENPNDLMPAERECVGWLVKEDPEVIWSLWDRSVMPFPHERIQPFQSGLIILKSDIVELKHIEY